MPPSGRQVNDGGIRPEVGLANLHPGLSCDRHGQSCRLLRDAGAARPYHDNTSEQETYSQPDRMTGPQDGKADLRSDMRQFGLQEGHDLGHRHVVDIGPVTDEEFLEGQAFLPSACSSATQNWTTSMDSKARSPISVVAAPMPPSISRSQSCTVSSSTETTVASSPALVVSVICPFLPSSRPLPPPPRRSAPFGHDFRASCAGTSVIPSPAKARAMPCCMQRLATSTDSRSSTPPRQGRHRRRSPRARIARSSSRVRPAGDGKSGGGGLCGPAVRGQPVGLPEGAGHGATLAGDGFSPAARRAAFISFSTITASFMHSVQIGSVPATKVPV